MRKIKNHTKQKFIALAVLLILAISVGYAALSTTLTINGTANIASNSWLVYFTNVQVKDGSVTATTAPSTEGTSTTTLTWIVNIQTPGDFYEYNVDVKNDGTIDAMIGNLSNTPLTTDQAKYLNYTVTYDDGATIEQYDKLDSGETVTLKVRIEYKTGINPEDLPNETSIVTLTYESNYVQADENAKLRTIAGTPVRYAVQIYGINQDVDENDNPLGLTFGPAIGYNYNNKYVTHKYEETSIGSGIYYVKIVTHTVDSNGNETSTEEYLTNSASENVTRNIAEKNKYDINMHEMTWKQIAAVSDKTAFLDCMLCGDTKKVQLYLNDTIVKQPPYSFNQYGDGAGMLAVTIKDYYRKWNPNPSDNQYVGTGITLDSNEIRGGSNARNAGGYSTSHIRATLIGEDSKTDKRYAGNDNLNTSNSLFSCIQSDLRNVITAKKIKYVTGTSTSNYRSNDDIIDKLWLFSSRELYGTGNYSGAITEGIETSGDGYDKFRNNESKYYISSYSDQSANVRQCYYEYDVVTDCWLRSPYLRYSMYVCYLSYEGNLVHYQYANKVNNIGVSFGFCIK